MWNVPNFETFPQRRWLMIGSILLGDAIDFETDAGPNLDPLKFSTKVFTACEIV